jgi:DNA-binding CsgD family transcriptional regulator
MASSVNLGSAAIKLTEKILGYNADDLAEILKEVASEIGVSHIAHMRFGPSKSSDISLLTAVNTYSREWQYRYFVKQYLAIDPVIKHGRTAILPFDWEIFSLDDPAVVEFFADAMRHKVGRHGVSIPVRNRRNAYSVVSFATDLARPEWDLFKLHNMPTLQQLSALIDSAASVDSKLPPAPVQLSRREEQCLIWAARGKTYQEIGEILELSYGSVKSHLDTARHKLHCLNLTHAVGVALATGVIPPQALRRATEGENRADS